LPPSVYSLSRKNGGWSSLTSYSLANVRALPERVAEQAEQRQLALEAAQSLGVEAELERRGAAWCGRAVPATPRRTPPSPSLRFEHPPGTPWIVRPIAGRQPSVGSWSCGTTLAPARRRRRFQRRDPVAADLEHFDRFVRTLEQVRPCASQRSGGEAEGLPSVVGCSATNCRASLNADRVSRICPAVGQRHQSGRQIGGDRRPRRCVRPSGPTATSPAWMPMRVFSGSAGHGSVRIACWKRDCARADRVGGGGEDREKSVAGVLDDLRARDASARLLEQLVVRASAAARTRSSPVATAIALDPTRSDEQQHREP
jgi:hypothetical protein